MKVIVVANVEQQQEIASKTTNPGADLMFIKSLDEYKQTDDDAIIYLLEDQSALDFQKLAGKPVLINSVIETLEEKKWPLHYSRINGWPGFLQNKTWEVVSNNRVMTSAVFDTLGWNAVYVADEPGLVSCRVISMIINEAFFALGEKVSTVADIDLAMRLGTNYPYGPFEWKDKIGLQKIYLLLKSLSSKDSRYSVAPLLEEQYSALTNAQNS